MTNELDLATNGQNYAPAVPDPSDQAIGKLIRQAQAMSAAQQIGEALAKTAMVPDIYRGKPDNAAAAILYGAELGMSAIQSLQQVFVIHGKPAIYARTMAALVRAAGHRLSEESATAEAVTWTGRRGDTGETFTSTWTIERAQTAKYTSNDKYRTNPIEMLRAKCQAELCRTMAPDVLMGISYSREELEMERPTVRVESERVSAAELLAAKTAPAEEKPAAKRRGRAKAEESPAASPMTEEQREQARIKFDALGLTDEQRVAFAREVCGDPELDTRRMTDEQGRHMLAELDDAIDSVIDGKVGEK